MFTSVGQWYFKITNPNSDKFIFYFDSVEYGQNVHKPYNNLLKCTPGITENNTYKYGLTVTSDGITILKLSTEVSVAGSEIGSSEQTFIGNLIYFR